MTLRQNILKGAALLTIGQGIGQVLALLRTIIVARVLSPHDVGIAATLTVTLSLAELLADLSIDKLLIQADNGDEARMRATAQMFSVCRGIIQATGLFLLSWPVAKLFDTPDITWAFQAAAMVPLIRGFAHLDVFCAQRDLRFTPAVISEIVPQVLSLALIWPLAHRLGDFRAVLYAAIVQAVMYLACTHLTASRPYSWATDSGHLRKIRAFGWPLVINGALLFAINQGDRVAVGAAYSKEQLAVWSNALMLASAPLMLAGKVAVSIALPVLSKSRSNQQVFDDRYALAMEALAMVAAMMTVPFLLAGGAIAGLIFGTAYVEAGSFIGLLALGQAIRVCRIGPTVGALSHGLTTNLAAANVGRLLGVGLAVVATRYGAELKWVALAAVAGEIAALTVAIWQLGVRSPIMPMQSVRACLPLAAALALAGLFSMGIFIPGSQGLLAVYTIGISIAIAAFLLYCYKRLRREPELVLARLRGVPVEHAQGQGSL